MGTNPSGISTNSRTALTLGALGVVFGDIGTSPLYTIQTVFDPGDPHPVAATVTSLYGVVSLIFWSVTVVVTIKYVVLVMRADNNGEGGILALITLLQRRRTTGGRRTKMILAILGIFGASLFFGDSMITPAISVLSAVEGLKVVQPSLAQLVLPVTVMIVVVLFASQRFGSEKVGRLFGPVMVVWFAVIGACGISGIARHPEVLRALLPTYALEFVFGHFSIAFFALAAVVLAITGCEALYADLGHFGRPAITRAWLFLVFPACILSYLGQGALILGRSQGAISSPFFLLAPGWARLPMVILATFATVIASQAVITGAFSLSHQAVQIGYLPRLRITHTSARTIGQIYVPWINWLLMSAVLVLVLAFRSSTALAFSYGMAVTGTITITTILYFYVVRHLGGRPLWLVLLGGAAFLSIDLMFLAANMTKFLHGAWVPLLIAVTTFTVLTTWQRGRAVLAGLRDRDEGTIQDFIDDLHAASPSIVRVPGAAVFLNRGTTNAPLAMRANLENNHVLHEQVVILAIEALPIPYVASADRVVFDDLAHVDDGIIHVTAQFGYMEAPHVPPVLREISHHAFDGHLDVDHAVYFLSTVEVYISDTPRMPRWRKHLFLATSRLTADAAEYFALPRHRTVIMGSRIGI